MPVPLSMDTLFDVEEKRSVSDSSSVGVSVFLEGVGCVGSVGFVSSFFAEVGVDDGIRVGVVLGRAW